MSKRLIPDPMASAAEIIALSKKNPLEALRHPNCPVELWWELAAKHPTEAQQSLLYPLLTLEEPERWLTVEDKYVEGWVNTAIDTLSFSSGHLFAADCAEQCLSLFETVKPNDKRPREAIRMRRLFARGKVTQPQWDAAKDAAREAGSFGSLGLNHPSARDAAYAASSNSIEKAARDAALAAAWARGQATGFDAAIHAAWASARIAAQRWQWSRLQYYLKQKAGAK